MTLVHGMLTGTAQRQSSGVACFTDTSTCTFAELDLLSDRLAGWLQQRGIARGDRVVLMMENSPALVIALFAVLKAGGVFVVVNPTTKADKLGYILGDSGARGIVASGRIARQVLPALAAAPSVTTIVWAERLPADPAGGILLEGLIAEDGPRLRDPLLIDEDLAAIIYTSGSTGRPKGVMLTHRNLTHSAWSIATYLEIEPDDVISCVLPLSFGYGLTQVLLSAHAGCSVLLERSFAFPADVMRRVAEHRVTGLPGVPTVFATILRMAPFDGLDLSSLRFLTNAAAALPPAHLQQLQALFPDARIYSMYGQTECTRVSFLDPDRVADKPSSVGTAIPNMEAYVVDEHGARATPGEIGELVVRGASVMRGYWGDPSATAQRLRPGEIQGELVLHTGDLFRTDEEGLLYFVGRTDDVFDCKGEKISPKEIEHVLYELDEVQEVAVIGVPDDLEGFAIKVFVAPSGRGTLDEQLVRRHCRERLESFMVPKHVEIRDALPKTDSGKVRKASLR